MKKRTRIISGLMAATMFVGLGMGTTEVMARSSTRAAWNNAAGDAKEEITLNNTHLVETNEDGNETTVQSNVYADSTKWAAWQKNWSTIKNNYYQVALTPGKNATELNFAWYSSATQTPRVKLMNSNGVEINTFTGTQSAASDEYNEYMAQNNCYNLLTGAESLNKVVDPKGAVYFEANSSTGSKYYQMIGTQQNYIAARSQSWRPTYSVLDITETTLTVNTYDAASGDELVADGGIDTTYTIVKSVDKTALNTEMASAQASYDTAKKAGNYTEASLKTLEDTLTAAKAVLENEEAGTTEIASAITSLQDAVKGLTVKTATVIADTTSANTTEDVQSALLAAIATSTGEIDATIPKDTTVTKTVMEAAKAAGLKAIYHSDAKSKVTWKFNSITTPKDFNPEVTVGTKIAAVDSALKKLSVPKTTKLTEVEFAFDGELPGTAEVTLDLSEAGFTDNSKVYLYYCNEEKGEFELAGEATYKAGEATFEITHCSNYVVSNEKLPAANTSLKSVQAGDNSPVAMILWFALGLTGMAGVGAVGFTEYKRKKNMNGEAE